MRPTNTSPSGRAAFTLIEIMVVVVILGVVAGALVPNLMGSMNTVKLDAAASQVADLLAYSHQATAVSGRMHAVLLEPEGARFDVIAEPTRDPENDDPYEQLRLEKVWVPGLIDRALPEPIIIRSVSTFEEDLVEDDSGRYRILFFPDGTTEFATIYLADPTGDVRAVHLNGLTGAIRIEKTSEAELDEEAATEEEGEA